MSTSRFQILRFAVVGTIVAALYVLLYLGLLAFGLIQPVANLLAFGSAVTVQYIGQAWWTFRQPLVMPEQIFRFTCTIVLGFVVSALITGLIGPALNWPDALAAAVVTVVLPVQNYLFFRIWVFAGASE